MTCFPVPPWILERPVGDEKVSREFRVSTGVKTTGAVFRRLIEAEIKYREENGTSQPYFIKSTFLRVDINKV